VKVTQEQIDKALEIIDAGWTSFSAAQIISAAYRAEKEEADELRALFDLQRTRSAKAESLWNAAHPGNELTRPDLGALLEWLMARAELAERQYEELRKSISPEHQNITLLARHEAERKALE
jgi:hypothetical protein